MPCNDGGGGIWTQTDVELRGAREKVDALTRLLCDQCRALDVYALQAGHVRPSRLMTYEVRSWWEAHQAEDRDREERERKESESARASKLKLYNDLKQELGL